MKCEILAPAGGMEQLEAAIKAGADAVYLGYGNFNARRNAKNFSLDELKSAVEYCHARNIDVHVTVNTLASDKELPLIYETLKDIALSGADAVIVQDLGVARIIRKHFPTLTMHASTQMTVHNVSGAKLLEGLGFKRVVLSRELSLKEIETIASATNLEIEVFIHGALCMSVSGGCYLSSVLGQRSGNRGLCAQPCRLDFKVNGRSNALSLKDMCHIEYLQKLISAGVTSFKIEGRMKRPEYVYSAVRAVRDKLENRSPQIEDLKKMFSRSGFTDGYMTGKRELSMFGIRTKEDVEGQKDVLKGFEMKEHKRIGASVNAEFTSKFIKITVSDGKNSVTLTEPAPEKALNRQTEKEEILKQLKKVGNTEYFIENIEVFLEDGLFIPVFKLNELRRSALSELTKKRILRKENVILPFSFEKAENSFAKETLIRVLKKSQLKYIENSTVILPLDEIDGEILKKHTVIGEIPALVYPFDEEFLKELLLEKKRLGLKTVYAENLGAVWLGKECGLEIIGGTCLNVLNSLSLLALKELGVKGAVASFESSIKGIEALQRHIPVGALLYGYLPLMRMRACPLQARDGCKGCLGQGKITDRMNVDFTLLCNNKRFTALLNSLPLYAGDKNVKADISLLYFNLEKPEEIKEICEKFGSAPWFERTTGLYLKTLK